MSKKNQPEEERRPDLATPDQDEIEQRVKEMLDLSEENPTPAKPDNKRIIEIKHHEEDTTPPISDAVGSAPELPAENKEEESAEPQEDLTSPDEPAKPPAEETDTEADDPEDEPPVTVINLDNAPKDAALITEEELLNQPVPEDQPETEEPIVSGEEPILKPAEEPISLNDAKTSRAVDDIIAKESDELLAVEDEKLAKTLEPDTKGSLSRRIVGFFKSWWGNPKARWITIGILTVLITVTFIVPTTRYVALNALGLRGTASLTVLDASTSQPLRNVEVALGGVSEKTDANGSVNLQKVRLGTSELVVKKRAFAEEKKIVSVSMGNNALGKHKLQPVGVQYLFAISDFLSKKPLEKVDASRAEATALSDKDGKIKLTIDDADDNESFEVALKLEGYREEKIKLDGNSKNEQVVVLVPARKHVFVTNRTGKFDLKKIDVDGKNEKEVLAGTGSERADIALAAHPNADVAALVSTRDNKRNKDGYLLSTLSLIDLQNDKVTSVTQSERVQLIDWVGDRLIYVQATSGASATNPKRHRLMSYDFRSAKNQEIAASNYFNDVIVAKGKVYYAPSSAYQVGNTAELYRVEADGSGKATMLNKEVWNIFRIDYDNLALSSQKEWANLRLGENTATSLSAQPSALNSRTYVDSADTKHSLWVDNRDGKGVLLAYQQSTKEELSLRSQSGLKNPLRWLNNKAIVYRISNEQETADYAISLDGGEPKKIRDVTNTNSIDQWYYY